ncbi:protein of unknown function [Nitrospira japonica]|uniref:Uncharacterized protein n=1 Tax=Nitrospira japonica TaxID=1325564 RepID=A0A1W1I9M1_9BACT|nr:protein of unknown function [Nitrospira japonica]
MCDDVCGLSSGIFPRVHFYLPHGTDASKASATLFPMSDVGAVLGDHFLPDWHHFVTR